MTTRYASCRCQHCSGNIEFDADAIPPGGQVPYDCPHCGAETILRHAIAVKKARPNTTGIHLSAALFTVVGATMVIGGCISSIEETESAARQTVHTVQYSAGFILIAICAAIWTLGQIVEK